jgi:hypothetical protein
VSCLTVTLSDFVNYFVPLSHGERTPVTRDQVWSGLRGHRRLACAARKQILERQIAEDAQVEQYESLTRNTCHDITWCYDMAGTFTQHGFGQLLLQNVKWSCVPEYKLQRATSEFLMMSGHPLVKDLWGKP